MDRLQQVSELLAVAGRPPVRRRRAVAPSSSTASAPPAPSAGSTYPAHRPEGTIGHRGRPPADRRRPGRRATGRGTSTSIGGKPRTLLQIRAAARYVVGVHLSEDHLTYVLVDYAGGVVARWRRDGPGDEQRPRTGRRAGSERDPRADRALRRRSGARARPRLRLPRPADRNRGVMSAPLSTTRWVGFPIRSRLEELLGMPALLENDATAAAAGTRLTTSHDVSVMAALFMKASVPACGSTATSTRARTATPARSGTSASRSAVRAAGAVAPAAWRRSPGRRPSSRRPARPG